MVEQILLQIDEQLQQGEVGRESKRDLEHDVCVLHPYGWYWG